MPTRDSERNSLTYSAVLAALGRSGPSSRAELARDLAISPATITSVTRALLGQGMIEEREHAPSTGGRPALRLGVVPDAAFATGVKVAHDHVTAVDVGLDGAIVHSEVHPFRAHGDDAPARLLEVLRPLHERRGDRRILGLGVCVPGVVDSPHSGCVDFAPFGWRTLDMGAQLRAGLGLPVLVENDVKALAVAELLFGRGREHDDFLVLTIGSGVGSALVSGGKVVRGAHGGAGEIGHVRVAGADRACNCGKAGCLETLISNRALLAAAVESGQVRPGGTLADLHAQAADGDAAALRLFDEAGRTLAATCAPIVAGLDPEVVIVLGEGVPGWRYWHDGFADALSAAVPMPARMPRVEVEDWDDTRWAQGAAATVLAVPFTNEQHGAQSSGVLARLNSVA